ncbi:MAG: hypothetical protein ACLSHU_04855 [Oscillospiraceae bacterium]
MIFLWIVLALVILALAVSYLGFRIACVRGHEYPWEDDAQMQKNWTQLRGSGKGRRGLAPAAEAPGSVPHQLRWPSAPCTVGPGGLPQRYCHPLPWFGCSSIVGDFSPSMPVYHDLGFNLLLVWTNGPKTEAQAGTSPSGVRES